MTTDLEQRLRARAARIRGYIESSERVVELLRPEMMKFDAREAPWDTYTVRLSVDHSSSIRTQTKEVEELERAADKLARLRAENERMREALERRGRGENAR